MNRNREAYVITKFDCKTIFQWVFQFGFYSHPQKFTARFRLLVQGCLQIQLIKASFNLNELIKGLGEKGSTSKAKAKQK